MDWQTTLEEAQATPPDAEALLAVIADVRPGARIVAVERMHGGLGAVLWRVDLDDHGPERLVLRGLMTEFGETGDHLVAEVTTHRLLSDTGLAVPRVLWSDPDGEAFGRPAFLMEFAQGRPLIGDLSRPDAASVMAMALRSIHSLPVPSEGIRTLATTEDHASYWLEGRRTSEVVDADAVYDEVLRLLPTVARPRRTWVHADFHGGNVLWDGSHVTAVLDWTHACLGEPSFDESYAHLDTLLAWGPDAASAFRTAYGSSGNRDLRFWDLLAVARALPSPVMWLPAYVVGGCTGLTEEDLVARYVEHTGRLLT